MSKKGRCRVTFYPQYKIGDKFKFTNSVTKEVTFYAIVGIDYSTCVLDYDFKEHGYSIEYWFKAYKYKGDDDSLAEFVISDDKIVGGTFGFKNGKESYEKVTDGYINRFIKQQYGKSYER